MLGLGCRRPPRDGRSPRCRRDHRTSRGGRRRRRGDRVRGDRPLPPCPRRRSGCGCSTCRGRVSDRRRRRALHRSSARALPRPRRRPSSRTTARSLQRCAGRWCGCCRTSIRRRPVRAWRPPSARPTRAPNRSCARRRAACTGPSSPAVESSQVVAEHAGRTGTFRFAGPPRSEHRGRLDVVELEQLAR